MSHDKHEPDNVAPAAPLALNKETLGDLDVETAESEHVKGGVSASGGSKPTSRTGHGNPTLNTLNSTA